MKILTFYEINNFSFWTNHMVCVLETTKESLIVGDPISVGPQEMVMGKIWKHVVWNCNCVRLT